ncbi:hypothetical protein FOMPIDRAFT_1049606 [Fomitopsis schrenkii]|uniref:DUF6533 domain-containing protein n=1 Tax=Fomitopsis schrenkii TaxID=2126942 RepID=S8EBA4_FOMSC|nr:hypothetical protein FOMPIDRAFT_1049606 [Fomitopsis schrenkii]
MSSSAAATISQEFLENCLTVSAQALCCYDFCLTFTRELKFMWKLKPSAVSLLFFTLRYPALLNIIMVVFGYLSWGTWQTQLMLVLGLINPVMSTYTFVLSTPYLAHITPHYQTCNIDTLFLGDIGARVRMMCARGSGVIFDAVALVLTWKGIKRVTRANSHGNPGEAGNFSGSSTGYGMSLVLLRDTAIYFGFLLAINSLGIAIGLSHPKATPRLDLNMEMTSILLSRLMLDLRQSSTADPAGGTYISHALTTMMFYGSSPAGGPGEDLTDSGSSDMDDEIAGSDDIDVTGMRIL